MRAAAGLLGTVAIVLLGFSPTVTAGPLDRQSYEPRRNPAADSMLRVPGVVGYPLDIATAYLQRAGLNPQVKMIERHRSEYQEREGQVVEQIPVAGGIAMLGSSVTIVVYAPAVADPPDSPDDQPGHGHHGGSHGTDRERPPAGNPSPAPGNGWGQEAPGTSASGNWRRPISPASPAAGEMAVGSGWQGPASVPSASSEQETGALQDEQPTETDGQETIIFTPAPVVMVAASQPEAAARGRYRIIATGFRVNRETWDHALNLDGCGDEIGLLSTSFEVAADGTLTPGPDRESKTHGDINHFSDRVRAGRGDCFSLDPPKGGLKTGDLHPGEEPWRRQGSPGMDRFPLLLWEGELIQDANAVMIIPSLWEYDSRGDLLNHFQTQIGGIGQAVANTPLGRNAQGIGKKIVHTAEMLGFPVEGVRVGVATLRKWVNSTAGVAAHRPVGMTKQGSDYVQVAPPILIFTYEGAEDLTVSRQGQLSHRFVDHEDLKGDYTLYLVIEKLQ